jgi:hypothetical protein
MYGLGATCYVLLTGHVPPHALRRAIRKEGDLLEPVNDLVPEIPERVAQAIARAMAIHSEDRFETVEQFWQELNGQLEKQGEELAPQNSVAALAPAPEVRSPQRNLVSAPIEPSAGPGRRRSLLAVAVLLLLVVVVGWASYLNLSAQNHPSPVVAHGVTATRTVSLRACASPASSTTVSSPAVGSSVYPTLAPTYAGTIYDNLTTQHTALCLANIQQQGGQIRGTMQGLGLVGAFQGTVTTDGKLAFSMPLYSGTETLVCTGVIKVAGDITGVFVVVNQQGDSTGESGAWNASVYQ